MSYDHRTRRKAKIQSLKALVFTLAFVGVITLCAAFFSLETYTRIPIPSQIRSLLGISGFREFSSDNLQGIGTAIQRSALLAHLPTNSQMWTFNLTPQQAEARSKQIEDIFKREKSVGVVFESSHPLVRLRENLTPGSQMFTERMGLVLLPGETIRFSANAFSSQNPKIAVRCLGVTPDRKDSAPSLALAIGERAPQNIDVSPRGETTEFSAARESSEATISIQWPKNAPGVLSILGEVTPHASNAPGVLLVTIDNVPGGLSKLPTTMKTLQERGVLVQKVSPFWPTSSDPQIAVSGVFTGQIPSNLGLTAPAAAFAKSNPFGETQTLERHMAKNGYQTLRIKLHSQESCPACTTSPFFGNLLSLSDFDVSVNVLRQHEIRQSLRALFRDFSGNLDGLFVHLSIEMPAEKLAYTWESALSGNGSTLSWIGSSWFGDNQQRSTSKSEKEIQLDQGLSYIFSKIQNGKSQRVIVSATTTSTTLANTDDIPAPFGEAWIPSSMLVKDNPGFTSQTSLFAAIPDFDKPHIADESVVTTQTSTEEVFITPSGWMSLPIAFANESEEPAPIRSHIPFASIEATQDAVQKRRENYIVQAVHLLVSNVSAQTGVQGDFTLPFRIFTCIPSQSDPSLEMKITGEHQNNLKISIQPKSDITGWQVSCLVSASPQVLEKGRAEDAAVLKLSAGASPIAPASIAIGEFALAGSLFKTSAQPEQVTITSPRVFLPAFISPQFRPPYTKAAYFWMERFPAVPSARGRRP